MIRRCQRLSFLAQQLAESFSMPSMLKATQNERVYTVSDYWDGPRGGIANFCGCPHLYECIFSDEEDQYTEAYRLTPISHEYFEQSLEIYGIFCRWKEAFRSGITDLSTHPAIPSERVRLEELNAALMDQIRVKSGSELIAEGRFHTIDADSSMRRGPDSEYCVDWIPK